MTKSEIIKRHNVTVHGDGESVLMLAHGFGSDQRMWRFVLPVLAKHYTVVLFDYVGWGNSQFSDFSVEKYSKLEGYASDVLDIISAMAYEKVIFCGHSVSGTVGLIAAIQAPEKFSELIMVCPTPCFLNVPPDYQGGFETSDLEELIDLMDKNYISWAEYLAPLVLGANSSKELVGELTGSFRSTDPIVAKTFAKATFFSDHRKLLSLCETKTLLLQSESDSLAAICVGRYTSDNMRNSELQIIRAEGHSLHMTNPGITARSMVEFLSR